MREWSSKARNWAVLAALLCLPMFLYPPWRGRWRGWLFSPPGDGSLDYGRLVLELGVVYLIAALVIFFASVQRWIWLRGKWSRTVSRSLFGIGGVLLILGGLWVVLQISQAFSADELALVIGSGAPTGNTFYGTVYNGSRSHVMREITIRVTFRPSSPGTATGDIFDHLPGYGPSPTTASAAADERDYQVRDLSVPPLGARSFSVGVIWLPGVEFDRWRIVSARGTRNYWPLW